ARAAETARGPVAIDCKKLPLQLITVHSLQKATEPIRCAESSILPVRVEERLTPNASIEIAVRERLVQADSRRLIATIKLNSISDSVRSSARLGPSSSRA